MQYATHCVPVALLPSIFSRPPTTPPTASPPPRPLLRLFARLCIACCPPARRLPPPYSPPRLALAPSTPLTKFNSPFLASRVLAGWPALPPNQRGPAPIPASLDSIVSSGQATFSHLELLADNLFKIDALSPSCLQQRSPPSSVAGTGAGAGAGASAAAAAAAAPPPQVGQPPSPPSADG